jgi:transcriptional regulator with XRE-family HTH domain
MVDRIKQIMAKEGCIPATFADNINVNRGTITHILSGRNNPSLDVLIKIMERYPSINPDWLLFGSAPMYRNQKAVIEPDLFVEKPASPANKEKYSKETEVKVKENTYQKAVNQETNQENFSSAIASLLNSRKINRIIIFYSDNTFEQFTPN